MDVIEYQQDKHSFLVRLGTHSLSLYLFPGFGQLFGRLWYILWSEWNLWDIAEILSQ